MTQGNDMTPGAIVTRGDARAKWGVSIQGGIVRSLESKVVLAFSDPARGEQLGYYDGWVKDEDDEWVFEYTGAGPTGDQVMLRGNKQIRDHEANGDVLHVFKAVDSQRGEAQCYRYLGEFGLDLSAPYIEKEEHDALGSTRIVIIFRMRPLGTPIIDESAKLPIAEATTISKWAPADGLSSRKSRNADATGSRRIAVEQNTRLRSTRRASGEVEVKRLEAELCRRFENFLESKEHEVCRYEIRVEGEPGIMRTDTCDETDLVLYEAKGKTTRASVREATAQLVDYRRRIDPKRKHCAVLLPSRPSDDLIDFIESQNLALVYEEADQFVGWPVDSA
jgi:hypothetical protein